jgi:hypothetical protein
MLALDAAPTEIMANSQFFITIEKQVKKFLMKLLVDLKSQPSI